MKLGKRHIVYLLAAFSSFAFTARAMTPGGIQKKFIALSRDVLCRSPAEIRAHAEDFGGVPYLDGIAFTLGEVELAPGGGAVMADTAHLMRPGQRWTREALASRLKDCREFNRLGAVKDNFLYVRIVPTQKQSRISWRDDAGWELFSENMAVLAWFAKEAGFKGMLLDAEDDTCARQYRYLAGDAESFDDCVRIARRRGRRLFSAVFSEFADIELIFLSAMGRVVHDFETGGGKDSARDSNGDGGLFPGFFNGMLDVMPPTVRFADASGGDTPSPADGRRVKSALDQFIGAKIFIAPENRAKYRAQLLVSGTHDLDTYIASADPAGAESTDSLPGARLERFRLDLKEVLFSADEYILIRGRKGNLVDWKRGADGRKGPDTPLWEDLIPGMTDMMLLLKDPDRLMAAKMEEKRRRGELKNLFEGNFPLPQIFEMKDATVYTEVKDPPSVKGVKPGEIYHVSLRYLARMHRGAPVFKVLWRKDGKPVGGSAALADDPGRTPNMMRSARTSVIVPDGADELVVSIAGDLYPGDSISVESIFVALVDASAETKAQWDAEGKPASVTTSTPRSKRKWRYDRKTMRLSDGNWTLKAVIRPEDKMKKSLDVDGRNAVGAGVLDFRGLEEDTGLKAVLIGGFERNRDITELIAPDVKVVHLNGFRECPALTAAEISPEFRFVGTTAFAFMPRFVRFSPNVVAANSRFGISSFFGSRKLSGDFYLEGTNAVEASLFSNTSIRSFRAPALDVVKEEAFSNNTNLQFVSFAERKRFSSPEERAAFLTAAKRKAHALRNILPRKMRSAKLSSVKRISGIVRPVPRLKGVKPGELYGVTASMKSTAYRSRPEFMVVWRKKGVIPPAWAIRRQFSMKGPRRDGVWRTGSALIRVPANVDELELQITVTGVSAGESYEFDKIEIFKLADPPPGGRPEATGTARPDAGKSVGGDK